MVPLWNVTESYLFACVLFPDSEHVLLSQKLGAGILQSL